METIWTDKKFCKILQDFWSLKSSQRDLKDQQELLLWVELKSIELKLPKNSQKDMALFI